LALEKQVNFFCLETKLQISTISVLVELCFYLYVVQRLLLERVGNSLLVNKIC